MKVVDQFALFYFIDVKQVVFAKEGANGDLLVAFAGGQTLTLHGGAAKFVMNALRKYIEETDSVLYDCNTR